MDYFKLGFNFVLLGQLQSDAIESRFGWFRQLSGANYFISMRQVLESDKKIRTLSLIKFSKLSLSEIDSAVQDTAVPNSSELDAAADSIVEALKFDVELSPSDASIIFYVSVAIARSTVAATKCDFCREVVICNGELSAIQVDNQHILDHESSAFLDRINRGGLVKPTDFVYQLVIHCWRVYEEIRHSAQLNARLLQSSDQRNLFCKIMDRATYVEGYVHLVFGCNMCNRGHDLQRHIVRRFCCKKLCKANNGGCQ